MASHKKKKKKTVKRFLLKKNKTKKNKKKQTKNKQKNPAQSVSGVRLLQKSQTTKVIFLVRVG